jgi:peroxiredoxin Q/BCP
MEAGERFPDFTAQTQDGEELNLARYQAGKNLIVFFYPRAMTSGCVRETTEFAARIGEFEALNTQVVGVSTDKVAAQKKHAIKCAAGFPILSDADKQITTQLGILNDRGTGSKRTTYLIDSSGAVRQVFTNVKVEGHVSRVLEAVKGL